jgi:hypothetical protein
MTKREIAALSFRILALWLFTEFAIMLCSILGGSIIAILTVFSGQRQADSLWTSIGFGAIPALIYLALSAILWINANRLAAYVYDDQIDDDLSGKITWKVEDVLAAAFAVMGVYIVVSAIPTLFRRLARLFASGTPVKVVWEDLNWQIEFWATMIQIFLGLWLAIGMRGIVRFLRSLQRRDTDFESNAESNTSL